MHEHAYDYNLPWRCIEDEIDKSMAALLPASECTLKVHCHCTSTVNTFESAHADISL